jgi:hypothetical protein
MFHFTGNCLSLRQSFFVGKQELTYKPLLTHWVSILLHLLLQFIRVFVNNIWLLLHDVLLISEFFFFVSVVVVVFFFVFRVCVIFRILILLRLVVL